MTSLRQASRQQQGRMQSASASDRVPAPTSSSSPCGSTAADPGRCAEAVMDTVPLIMRFIRSNLQDEEGDLPSVSQIRVLACLTANPGASLSDVAKYINVTKATASNMIARMVDKGLVQRLEDPNERRCVVLNATSAGSEIYLTARQHAQKAVVDVLQSLSEEQKTKITEALELLREAFLR
jgi:DNA-binding MarR family transcriptional regulator